MNRKDGFVIALYDVPMKTKQDKKSYIFFRKILICEGFLKLQESVYFRYVRNLSFFDEMIKKIIKKSPKSCNLKFIKLTINQFEKMNFYSLNKINISKFTSNIRII